MRNPLKDLDKTWCFSTIASIGMATIGAFFTLVVTTIIMPGECCIALKLPIQCVFTIVVPLIAISTIISDIEDGEHLTTDWFRENGIPVETTFRRVVTKTFSRYITTSSTTGYTEHSTTHTIIAIGKDPVLVGCHWESDG